MSATWSDAPIPTEGAMKALDRMRSALDDSGAGGDVPGMAEPAAIPEVVALALASIAESLAVLGAAVEREQRPVRVVEDVDFPGRDKLWKSFQDNGLAEALPQRWTERAVLGERDALRRHLAAALLDLGSLGLDRREWVDILPLCQGQVHRGPIGQPRDTTSECCAHHLLTIAGDVWRGDR